MTTTALGNRIPRLFFSADILLRRVSTGDTTTIYLANRSWITNPDDSVAPNRQYIGLLEVGYQFTASWFKGANLGGVMEVNRGQLRAINPEPENDHTLDWIFEEGWVALSILHRLGEIGEDLGAMIERTTAAAETRPSTDGNYLEIDLADDAQELDTSLFKDKFQGLGGAVRLRPGHKIRVPFDAGLQPTSGFCVTIAYRLPSWYEAANDLAITRWLGDVAGNAWQIRLLATGEVEVRSATAADVAVVLVTDLDWVADGRWWEVVAKWDDVTDTLRAFHSTRSGGELSTITAAQASICDGAGYWMTGDPDTDLGTHEDIDVALIALELDGDVPTDAEILARMKRPLSEDEGDLCEAWLPLNELTGLVLSDESPNTHNGEVVDAANAAAAYDFRVPSFEGAAEMAGQFKPLVFGHRLNVPIVWANQGNGEGVLHARCYKGVEAAYEGGERLVVGWPKRKHYQLTFDAASQTVSFADREAPTGVDREEAQPGLGGIAANQVLNVYDATNAGAFVVVSSTLRSITVSGGFVNEGPVDCFLEVLDADGGAPDVELWHDAGGVWYGDDGIPELPPTFEMLGDIGAATPTADPDVHWPEYVPAILRCLLEQWGEQAMVADNWDVDPANPIRSYFAEAGVRFNPSKDITILAAMAKGASGIWARFGQEQDSDTWDFEVIREPQQTAELVITALENIGLRRVKSVPPVAGVTLRGAVNDAPLAANDFVAGEGVVATIDREVLARPHLELSAAVDAAVRDAYPAAKEEPVIETWLRHAADIQAEAQGQYDIRKVEREVYQLDVVLFGLNKEPLRDEVMLTDENFPTLAGGQGFLIPNLAANDERVSMTLWGGPAGE